MKTLLFISDKDEKFNHSFIENVINGFLKRYFKIYCVYFTDSFTIKENQIFILKKDRSRALELINQHFLDLKNVDFIIVRNFLDVLKNAVKLKKKYDFKLYFQLSFPHFYRSYHEAKIRGKNLLFKFVKYRINLILYKNLINQCDGFFPISNLMKKEFFDDIKTSVLALPLGINTKDITKPLQKSGVKKFIYIGAIDINRQMDDFFNEFCKARSEFRLEIYTKDYEYAKTILPKDSRIVLHHAVSKDEIFNIMREFDVGCFYVPINRLYDLCSPTKVMDYYSCGLVCFSSAVGECRELFDDKTMFFIGNNIAGMVEKICATSRDELSKMAENGLEILIKKRNYESIADKIREFLK